MDENTKAKQDGAKSGAEDRAAKKSAAYLYNKAGKLVCDELGFIRAVNLDSEMAYGLAYLKAYHGEAQ